MTHMLEDLTHEMEGQPVKKEVTWVLGVYILFFSISYHIIYPTKYEGDHPTLRVISLGCQDVYGWLELNGWSVGEMQLQILLAGRPNKMGVEVDAVGKGASSIMETENGPTSKEKVPIPQ